MENGQIRKVVGEFLALIDGRDGSHADGLPLLLDRLAVAAGSVSGPLDEADYREPPEVDQAQLRRQVCQRFPDYGFYNTPESITEGIGNTECTVGDAIDDLVDIARDLIEVEWRWDNTSEQDALWHFRESYRIHWQQHLRCLQLYLQALGG